MQILSQLPKRRYFDYSFLMNVLRKYRYPRDKVTSLLKNGDIIRVKKGLYVMSRAAGGVIHTFQIANGLFGPSCVSLESALAEYGLIPEQPSAVTSVTPNRNRAYNTPLGLFLFRHVKPGAFAVGIHRTEDEQGGYFIASAEKAVCDMLALTPGIRTLGEIRDFLLDDLRLERDRLVRFDTERIRTISEACAINRIRLFYRWISELRE